VLTRCWRGLCVQDCVTGRILYHINLLLAVLAPDPPTLFLSAFPCMSNTLYSTTSNAKCEHQIAMQNPSSNNFTLHAVVLAVSRLRRVRCYGPDCEMYRQLFVTPLCAVMSWDLFGPAPVLGVWGDFGPNIGIWGDLGGSGAPAAGGFGNRGTKALFMALRHSSVRCNVLDSAARRC